jgi:(1->4)-alpha-D-glucan 1-alpha-D-glucosylmutase
VLTERARDWQARITAWSRLNRASRRRASRGWSPDRHDEYRFYQALVGIWPAGHGNPRDAVAAGDLVPRLTEFMIKSAREANRHTSWVRENGEYEDGLRRFVEAVLASTENTEFIDSVATFAEDVARAGVINSLAQTVVKIASPGIPDFYQGTEWWDLHLVDPDNRRIVDVDARRAALADIDERLAAADADRASVAAEYLDRWADGLVKHFVTAEALRLRRRHHETFVDGKYVPLEVMNGEGAPAALAFARGRGAEWVVAIVPRLASHIAGSGRWPVSTVWCEAVVELPEAARGRSLRDIFTGRAYRTSGDGLLKLADVLSLFPVALLSLDRPVE